MSSVWRSTCCAGVEAHLENEDAPREGRNRRDNDVKVAGDVRLQAPQLVQGQAAGDEAHAQDQRRAEVHVHNVPRIKAKGSRGAAPGCPLCQAGPLQPPAARS